MCRASSRAETRPSPGIAPSVSRQGPGNTPRKTIPQPKENELKTIIRLAALALALSLSVTGPAPAQQAKKAWKVGAAVYGLKAEFAQLWVNALKKLPLVKDGTGKLTVFDGKFDALTQNNQFETMIPQKYDGILFVPIDLQAGADAVSKAAEANIPVVGSNGRVNSDKLLSYVGSNDVIAGAMQ